MPEKTEFLTWEVQFPLLTNPHVVNAWIKGMGVTYLFCMLIRGPLFIAMGEIQSLPVMALICMFPEAFP